jgi:cell division protein FtsQ
MSRLTAKTAKRPAAGKTRDRKAPARRKPVARSTRRALTGAAVALPVAAVIGLGAWAWTSGWAGRTTTALVDGAWQLTADAGFAVEEVLVTGRDSTHGDDILAALGVDRGAPILAFDPDAARASVEALPWVARATVVRRLPDTIFIAIEEREPLALWQSDGTFRVIDQRGAVLTDSGVAAFAHLPRVVGADAPPHAAELLDLLARVPTVGARVEAAVRVGGRRWNLELDNGVTVRLPEDGIDRALARLAAVEDADGLFDRDIRSIDLRLADRLVIRTSPVANEMIRLPEENT